MGAYVYGSDVQPRLSVILWLRPTSATRRTFHLAHHAENHYNSLRPASRAFLEAKAPLRKEGGVQSTSSASWEPAPI